MYPKNAFKHCAGKKWQPSNGTEFMFFVDCGPCAACIHREDCPKPYKAQIFDKDDPNYPDWFYDDEGQPQCESREIKNEGDE